MNLYDVLLASKITKNNSNNAEIVDLSDYYTKSQTDGLISAKVDKEDGKGLSTNDFTNEYKQKINAAAPQSTTYTKTETDQRITTKVAEIVSNAPEDFDTLKEISDWIEKHENSAAAMNTAIVTNATAITTKVDKIEGMGLSENSFTNAEKAKLAELENYDDMEIKAYISSALSGVAINKATLGYQRKNMLKLSAITETKEGVTYTYIDGMVNASGTTTGRSTHMMFNAKVPLVFDKDVIVSYVGEMSNIICRAKLGEVDKYEYPLITKSGYRIPAGAKISQVYIQQTQSGVTVNATNVGVMLRYADITDDTYEPYKPSIEERLTALENAILGEV